MDKLLLHGRALLGFSLFTLVTLVIGVPLMSLAIAKLLLQKTRLRPRLTRWLDKTATAWISCNNAHQRLTTGTHIDVDGPEQFGRRQWFMLVVNHQSWVDILVLLRVFNRRIPYFKFFMKSSLIWFPVIGLACWALDFLFMKRHTREQIQKDPSLAGKDLATTQLQCERFSNKPVTIVSYVEGTRFTEAKHDQQQSPYRYLLIPKAGGLAFTLTAMSGRIKTLLDVTIHYPQGRPTFWQYLGGQVKKINVVVRERDVREELLGNYVSDEDYRRHFQTWVNQIWQEKDELLESLSQNENSKAL
ncbi:acyltransferase [Gilvimarinus sp. SDUM040013]|uniref:Acyltransferase n=1 Tax=Gilvimarinus gilvus TaxID=3058038 RepID=A0ABU4RVD7_9GAMM|nr:acyltransferase [Gilvimarinus sp. SDUM040013]MDO3386935.1 acyltransferase [Gilvimarinus sp. SDUM040013]MDX6848171.1 acyltransferase [Gilvimarinus sp. SDUM040013]